jgi:hypothetical protein
MKKCRPEVGNMTEKHLEITLKEKKTTQIE